MLSVSFHSLDKEMTLKPVRFGLLGYGLFGSHHAQAIAACDRAELTAVAARSEDSCDAARANFPMAEVTMDYREILRRDDIDIVDIVLPNQLHYTVALAALQAGKHVLLEKPMALEWRQCDELIDMAQQHGLTLAIGHELRLSSLWGTARQLIDEGAIGRVQHVLVELSRFPYRQGSEGWRYDIERVGSWILEEPIHFFDLAQWYLSASGDPASIYARANSRHPEHPELRDNFSAVVNYSDGAYAVVSQTLAAFGHHQSAKIVGTEGTIWATWSASDARSEKSSFGLRWGLGDQVQEMTLDKPAGELLELADEIDAVAKCVADGGRPPCTAEDGRWSTRLCLAAEASIARGGLVRMTDMP